MTRRQRDLARLATRVLVCALALPGAACAALANGDDDGDGGPFCEMIFDVEPEQPHPGAVVTVRASVSEVDVAGPHDYDWSVRFDAEPVEFDFATVDEDVIDFEAERAGVYLIELEGSVGGFPCLGSSAERNVLAPGSQPEDYLVRVTPPAGQPAPPPQDRIVQVWGGGEEFALGFLSLDPGIPLTGTSLDADGQPIPAYLRAWQEPLVAGAPPLVSESFAGADGAYAMQLLFGPHELLVVPASEELPAYHHSLDMPQSIVDSTRLAPGAAVEVTVRAGAGPGDPVAGARVSLLVDGVPSSVATTDSQGAATLLSTAPATGERALSISVVPPPESGLPNLELEGEYAGALAALEIRYAPSLSSRTVSLAVREADGTTPAPGSRVTWIARLPVAGTVAIDGGEPREAAGPVRRSAVAGAGGALPDTLLPEAAYDVVVEPPAGADPGQAVAMAAIDLGAGQPDPPATVELVAPAEVRGQVLLGPDEESAPLAGVRVQAAPLGLLASATRAGASARTDETGEFTLLLAGGGDYEITIDGTPKGQVRGRSIATAPAPGEAVDLEPAVMPRILRVTGELDAPSGLASVDGLHVQLFCVACGPDGSAVPVAETVSDGTGRFRLIAADPGVAAAESRRALGWMRRPTRAATRARRGATLPAVPHEE
jgi:hypothetical protein